MPYITKHTAIPLSLYLIRIIFIIYLSSPSCISSHFCIYLFPCTEVDNIDDQIQTRSRIKIIGVRCIYMGFRKQLSNKVSILHSL